MNKTIEEYLASAQYFLLPLREECEIQNRAKILRFLDDHQFLKEKLNQLLNKDANWRALATSIGCVYYYVEIPSTSTIWPAQKQPEYDVQLLHLCSGTEPVVKITAPHDILAR